MSQSKNREHISIPLDEVLKDLARKKDTNMTEVRDTAKMTNEFVSSIIELGFVEEVHIVNDFEIYDWVYRFGKMELSIDAWGDAILTQDGFDEIPVSWNGIWDIEMMIDFFKNLI